MDSIAWALYADDAPECLLGLWSLLTPEERAEVKRQAAEEDEWNDDA